MRQWSPSGYWRTHGRFRPDRIVCGPGTVTVDDFARSGPGDPARDVAELVFHLRRRAILGGDPGAIVLEFHDLLVFARDLVRDVRVIAHRIARAISHHRSLRGSRA